MGNSRATLTHLPRPLFDAIYEMNTARDHADFCSAVLAGLSRLIPSDYCHLHVLNRLQQKLLYRSLPEVSFNETEAAYYAAHPQGNPLVAYFDRTGATHARRVSDVLPTSDYVQTDHYRNCLARLGIKYSLALPVTVEPDTVAALVFDRTGRDFTSNDCALLDAFAPHFYLAWARHTDPWTTTSAPSSRERLRSLGLTPREADVLFWMIEGKQNREIATILGRSLDTVQEHVANIVRKLHQENRHAATVFALRHLLVV